MHCKQIGTMVGGKWDKMHDYNKRIYSTKACCPTLMTHTGGGMELKLYDNGKIRKLTPRESWRLMGFTDSDFDKVEHLNRDTQLYKQAGNSIVVTVLEAILRQLLLSNDTATGAQMRMDDYENSNL